MNPTLRRFAAALLILLLASPASATCGGGGGGGVGGVAPDVGGSEPKVYRVSWQVLGNGQAVPPESALVVYWFPTSPEGARASAMQTSRTLSLAGARCVAAALVPPDNKALHESLKAPAGDEAAVIAKADGTEIGRVGGNGQAFDVKAVEKMLSSELERREEELEALYKGAEKKAKSDREGAIADYKKVWAERCLFPSLGKKAAKGLKKLGEAVQEAALLELGPEGLADPDVYGRKAEVESTLLAGLEAEIGAKYREAESLYVKAVELDPADATALRFLAEFYRHQTGDWDKATTTFRRVLEVPADPIARAVALHGLGKMTIHSGRFDEGLSMFHRSIAAYPLPITYRNLAVYWFSEKQEEKAAGFMRQAIALDPNDRYNQIFAAVYLAAAGKHDEAIAVAQANHDVMEASYNLAAIWAQAGDRAKAMAYLKRHFYEYEQFDAVRGMEMREAKDDYMFASLHNDPAFIELTSKATRFQMKPAAR